MLAAAYVRFIYHSLHPYLAVPRIEMLVSGLLIVALSFYASLAINGPQAEWRDSKIAAFLILMLVTLPYGLFQWWITWGRIVLLRKVSREAMYSFTGG